MLHGTNSKPPCLRNEDDASLPNQRLPAFNCIVPDESMSLQRASAGENSLKAIKLARRSSSQLSQPLVFFAGLALSAS